jgi:hypothetical protein
MKQIIFTPQKSRIQYRWSLRRFAKNMLLLVLVCGLATIFASTAVKATFSNDQPQIIEIKVASGDTLWSIAQKIEPSTDPRLVIYRIKEYNRLVSSNLEIGQCLAYQLPK